MNREVITNATFTHIVSNGSIGRTKYEGVGLPPRHRFDSRHCEKCLTDRVEVSQWGGEGGDKLDLISHGSRKAFNKIERVGCDGWRTESKVES